MNARPVSSHRPGRPASVLGVALLLAAALLPACTHYVPVITRTVECPIDEDQLRACAAPAPIAPELTYGGLIELAQGDRQNLARCALQQRDLAAAVRKCQAAIKALNAEIELSNDAQRKLAK